jgi:hypothetical protein
MPSSSYSYIEYDGTGLAATTFSFDDIDTFADVPVKDQVDVYVNDQIKTYTTHYTISGKEVTFTTGNIPASGAKIRIERDTTIADRIVNFTNSSILTAADLNKNTDQLLFLIQEVKDDVDGVALTSVDNVADGAITAEKLKQTAESEAVVTNAIRDNAVKTAKIDDLAVTTAKIADDAVTNDKMSAGAPTWEPDGDVSVLNNLGVAENLDVVGDADITGNLSINGTLEVTGNVTGDTTFSDDVSVLGNMSFNSGYGSSAVAYGCRAWLSFTTIGSLTATYTRTGSTVTVTRNNHGYSNGTYMYIDFGAGTGGTATDGFYQISNVTTNTFDITDTASGTITSGTGTTIRAVVTAMRNIASVTYVAANKFTVTMTNAMPDSNYVVNVTPHSAGDSRAFVDSDLTMTTTEFRINGVGTILRYSVAVFR